MNNKDVICLDCKKIFSANKRVSPKRAFCFLCKENRRIIKRKNRYKINTNCSFCGSKDGKHPNKKICKRFNLWNGLIKYFGFDKTKLGSFGALGEYFKIIVKLRTDYIKNKMSIPDMIKKYGYYDNPRNFSKILEALKIKRRSCDAGFKIKLLGGMINFGTNKYPFPYQQQWHTTREGTQVYLRSSYETEVANQLDLLNIPYITEKPIIEYINEKGNPSAAYPDFYLPDHNILIEVKSTYFRNKENMELKFKAYEALGYKCVLIVDKKVVIGANYAIEVGMYQEEVMAG